MLRPIQIEPFVIVYTSGTTSRPKGCVHTFNTYCAGSRALVGPFGYTETDVQFGPSPIAHTTGLVTSVLVPMLTGASTHLMAKWDPARGIDEIQRFGCTAAVTAPTFLQTLLSEYDAERHDLSTLAAVDMCGRAHPCCGRQAGQRRASQHQGTQPLRAQRKPSHHNMFSHRRRLTRPHLGRQGDAGSEVKIVDDKGNEVPRGTEGDIAYRGPAHMIEYLANPEETAALFTKDGFSRSGDLGKMTDDGYVRVTGRTKDIVIRGGMNISVREIEEHLAHHPALQAFSVVGMPDEKLGEKVCCYLVSKPGNEPPTVDGLREYLLGEGMPIQKTPERVVALDSLPMTATGKILKHELRKDIEQRLNEESAQSQQAAGAP